MRKLSPRQKSIKPTKPHRDFPLFAHATGRWAKKVRGRLCYFGKWDDPDAALERWLAQKDDLLAGRMPRARSDGLTVRDLCNAYLTAKQLLVDSGELARRTFVGYYATCERLINFGKLRLVDDLAADDFERLRASLARTCGPVTLCSEIGRIRSVFKYAFDAGLIEKPIRFGPHFKRPNRKTLRLAREAKGTRMLEPPDLRRLIEAAAQPLKAMLLLGLNAGLGNADVGQLKFRHVNLAGGWLNYPRPKTGIARRAAIWPETVKALRDAVTARPKGPGSDGDGFVFLTRCRQPWWREVGPNPLSAEFAKLAVALKLDRSGVSFYSLRHIFRTVADETRDQPAVDHVMGHAPAASDMASVYRERISDERLKAVSDHVRLWLFGAANQ